MNRPTEEQIAGAWPELRHLSYDEVKKELASYVGMNNEVRQKILHVFFGHYAEVVI